MKERLIGVYKNGSENVELAVHESNGGHFYSVPEDGGLSRITIGMDYQRWHDVVSTLLHEAIEMQLMRVGARFNPNPDYSRDSANWMFVMNHSQHSEVCARVAIFVTKCLPALATCWRKHRRKTKKKNP